MAKTRTDTATDGRKLVVELAPLLLFFLANALWGIFVATGVFMAAAAAAIGWSWQQRRHVPPMMWISGVLVLVFGSLTLWLADETFIKIKPTLVYLLFAAVLGGGLLVGRIFLATLLGTAFPALAERGWRVMTRNWALFFLGMAGLNEAVWRSLSTDAWVAFKSFGVLPLTLAFALAQVPVVTKYRLHGDGG